MLQTKRLILLALLSLLALPLGAAAQQFQSPVYYRVGAKNANLKSGVWADFNHDGFPDFAVGQYNGKSVAVLLGKGDGTFLKPYHLIRLGSGSVALSVGDFNGDTIPDLAVIKAGEPAHLSLFLGNGDGSFHHSATYRLGTGSQAVVVADFNGDGKADVAVTNYSKSFVQVFLGNGDGTLQPPKGYGAPLYATGITAADLNGDGHFDLIVTGFKGAVSILLNNGDGTFQKPLRYKVGSEPSTAAIGDLNHDNKPDLVVASAGTQGVYVFLGNGDGSFGKSTFYPTLNAGNGPFAVTIADFNGNGNPDVAVATQSVHHKGGLGLLYGNGDGTLQTVTPVNLGHDGAISLVSTDLNKDGHPDVVVTSLDGFTVGVLLGQ